MSRWGALSVRNMENELTQSLMLGEQFSATIDRMDTVTGEAWWQAERIARSECAYAFNVTQRDGIAAVSHELPGIMLRWTEYVDDASGEPLDTRVDVDSEMLHGQVAGVGEEFVMPDTMPDGTPVPKEKEHKVAHLRGKSWAQPPNRPNCRATVIPWRKEWGIPGWRYIRGRRVPVE